MTLKKILRAKPQDFFCWFHVFFYSRLAPLFWTAVFKAKALFYGVEFGSNIEVAGTVHLMRSPLSRIKLGKRVSVVSSSQRCFSGSIYAPVKLRTLSQTAEIVIGDNVGLNGTSIVARSQKITIGDGAMIAPNVTIVDSDFHALWPPETRLMNPAFEKDKDIKIGKKVWIGMRCIILRGAIIGDNSIISAGSIVQKKIPKNVVAGGTPAEVMFTLQKAETDPSSVCG